MSLPGFSAEASVPRSSSVFVAGETPSGEEGKIIPQQCYTTNGPCTGILWWYQGEQCVTGYSTGAQHCCTAAGQWPVIRECRNPDGTWRVVRAVCAGPCT